MSALLVLIGLLAALTAGLLAWVTLGTVAAVVVAVILLGLAFYAAAHSMLYNVPLRRVSHHTINLFQRRQYLKTIATIKRGVAYFNDVTHDCS